MFLKIVAVILLGRTLALTAQYDGKLAIISIELRDRPG